MKHLSEMVGAFIMQGSEEMYKFGIKEISKEETLKMIRKYHYSKTRQWLQRQWKVLRGIWLSVRRWRWPDMELI